jgi:hypothetical protein
LSENHWLLTTLGRTFGLDQARGVLADLGERYRGAITIDTGIARDEFNDWVRILSCSGKKPVLLFDSSGSHSGLVRPNLSSVPSYYRLFLDEPAAIGLALKSLSQIGHRTIGVPIFEHDETWAAPRFNTIRNTATALFPEATVVQAVHQEAFWVRESAEPHNKLEFLAENFRRFIAESGQIRKVRPGLLRKKNPFFAATPSMMHLLEAECTALIALNDWRAHQYLVWFRNAGLRIPEDMSIVSFDNLAESETVPISTVDFGFARLGYLAAHILIGDIPVKADKQGNIAGICTLMDRGSIGMPRKQLRESVRAGEDN